jgi:hypothetical protein
MIACLHCGHVCEDRKELTVHVYDFHPNKEYSEPGPKKKNALPDKFGIILILYGIFQMPVYYFIIRLSYNHEAWFQALIVTDVTPGIVFYALGLWMISIIVLIGGVALILTRDKLLQDGE